VKVTLIASTQMHDIPRDLYNTKFGYQFNDRDQFYHWEDRHFEADTLAHFAGRACYQAWNMPNPATATDEGYIANIINQGHFSVLEHASATFYIEGVSRSLLAELTRHRHASFSVESQRYVDYSGTEPVIPPAMRGTELEDDLRAEYKRALTSYESYVNVLTAQGKTRKEAREAARAVLPNCAPVGIVLTGNMRAYRDILVKRYSTHADAEIRELATEILRQLRGIAESSFQDFPETPFE
jgi:thymidylate synthase (FAD)